MTDDDDWVPPPPTRAQALAIAIDLARQVVSPGWPNADVKAVGAQAWATIASLLPEDDAPYPAAQLVVLRACWHATPVVGLPGGPWYHPGQHTLCDDADPGEFPSMPAVSPRVEARLATTRPPQAGGPFCDQTLVSFCDLEPDHDGDHEDDNGTVWGTPCSATDGYGDQCTRTFGHNGRHKAEHGNEWAL